MVTRDAWKAQLLRPFIVEGGGTRGGALALGSLLGWELAEMSSPNVLFGTSAGAVAAAYTATRQWDEALWLLLDVVPRSIRWARAPLGSLIDMPRLARAMRHECRLDVAALWKRRTSCRVGITDARTGGVRYVELGRAADPVKLLCASMALPGASPPVRLEDGAYFDGATQAFPIRRVEELRPPRAVAIVTKPTTFRRAPSGALGRRAMAPLMRGLHRAARRRFVERHLDDNASRDYLTRGGDAHVRWTVIAPSTTEDLGGRFTRDRDLLLAGLRRGALAAVTAVDEATAPNVVQRLERILARL